MLDNFDFFKLYCSLEDANFMDHISLVKGLYEGLSSCANIKKIC